MQNYVTEALKGKNPTKKSKNLPLYQQKDYNPQNLINNTVALNSMLVDTFKDSILNKRGFNYDDLTALSTEAVRIVNNNKLKFIYNDTKNNLVTTQDVYIDNEGKTQKKFLDKTQSNNCFLVIKPNPLNADVNKKIFIVEGVFDALAIAIAGFTAIAVGNVYNMVTLANNSEFVNMLKGKNVYVYADRDFNEAEGTLYLPQNNTLAIALDCSIIVNSGNVANFKDANDILKDLGKHQLTQAIEYLTTQATKPQVANVDNISYCYNLDDVKIAFKQLIDAKKIVLVNNGTNYSIYYTCKGNTHVASSSLLSLPNNVVDIINLDFALLKFEYKANSEFLKEFKLIVLSNIKATGTEWIPYVGNPLQISNAKLNTYEPTQLHTLPLPSNHEANLIHLNTLLSNLFNTQERLDYITCLLAYKYHNPHKTCLNSQVVALLGTQGSGKGAFRNVLIELFKHVHTLSNPKNLTSNFNSYMFCNLFVVLEENPAFIKGEVMEAIKTYSGATELEKTSKGIDSTKAKTYASFVICGNASTIPLDSNDRRFKIFYSGKKLNNEAGNYIYNNIKDVAISFYNAYLKDKNVNTTKLLDFATEETEQAKKTQDYSLLSIIDCLVDDITYYNDVITNRNLAIITQDSEFMYIPTSTLKELYAIETGNNVARLTNELTTQVAFKYDITSNFTKKCSLSKKSIKACKLRKPTQVDATNNNIVL